MQNIETVVEVNERGVAAALVEDMLHIYIRHSQPLITHESLAGSDYLSILGYDAVAREYEVGRGLANACRAVDIAAQGSRRLLLDKRAQIAVLANDFGCGREVEDKRCSRQSHIR